MALKIGELVATLGMDPGNFNSTLAGAGRAIHDAAGKMTLEQKAVQAEMKNLEEEAVRLRAKLLKAVPDSPEARKLEQDLSAADKRMRLLSATSGDLQHNLEKQGEKLRGFGNNMFQYVTLPIAAAGAALFGLMNKSGEFAEHLLNTSAATDISTKHLQEYKYIADSMGLSFDTITRSITMFEGRIPMIEAGTGPAADAMKLLGVNVNDASGHMRSMDSLFPEIISKLQADKNATERNALAKVLFGRGAMDLLPILGMSKAKWDELSGAADRNTVLTDKQIKALKDFKESVNLLMANLAGLTNKLMAGFESLDTFWQKTILAGAGLAALTGIVIKGMVAYRDFKATLIELEIVQKLAAAKTWILNAATAASGVAANIASIDFAALWTAILGPIGLVIAGIALVAGAAYLIIKNWKPISAFFSRMWKDVEEVFSDAWKWITGWFSKLWKEIYDLTVGKLTAIADFIGRMLGKVGGFFKDLYDKVVGHSYVPDMINGVANSMNKLDPKMAAVAQKATDKTAAHFAKLADAAKKHLAHVADMATKAAAHKEAHDKAKDAAELKRVQAQQTRLEKAWERKSAAEQRAQDEARSRLTDEGARLQSSLEQKTAANQLKAAKAELAAAKKAQSDHEAQQREDLQKEQSVHGYQAFVMGLKARTRDAMAASGASGAVNARMSPAVQAAQAHVNAAEKRVQDIANKHAAEQLHELQLIRAALTRQNVVKPLTVSS